jgi:very-short-patch-repair endonuclease
VTTPARTLLDLADDLPRKGLRRATRQAQAMHWTNVRQIADVLARANGRRGAARLAALIADGPAPTRSELEDVVLDLILAAGLQRPAVNERLGAVFPDLRWPDQRLTVECDGAAWHDGTLAREDDAERQARLEATGERVLRVTWRQAVTSPRQTLARMIAAGAPYTDRQS